MMKKTEEELEKETAYWYELGKSKGLEIAASFILVKATDYFKECKDGDATQLRYYAKELKKMADIQDEFARKGRT